MLLEKLNSATSKIKLIEEKLQDINLIKDQKKIFKNNKRIYIFRKNKY